MSSVIHPKCYVGWFLDLLANPTPHFLRQLLIAPTLVERDFVKRISH